MKVCLIPRVYGTRGISTKEKLLRDGYVVIPNVLEPEMIIHFNNLSTTMCEDPKYTHLQEDKYTGSLIPVSKHPEFAKLIAHRYAPGVRFRMYDYTLRIGMHYG